MSIGVWDYLREYEEEKDEILAAVARVLSSGRLILGPCVEAFESEFASYCGVKQGVGVDNGTNAIFLGLKALGVGAGDEVITVSFTAVPTISAIVSAGAVPRFVDIEAGTYLMDVSMLESVITPRTKCIIPVHLYGQCVNMDEVRAVADRHGLTVLEDCAQCHGAEQNGNKAGSMSDASAFSFYPTKTLGAYGDGGMVLSNRDNVIEKLRALRFYGMNDCYYAEEHGYNSRLDELHAEILRVKLKRLDGYIERRRQIARRYDELLAGTSLIMPETASANSHCYHLYVVRSSDRDRIIKELKDHDISLGIHYPCPVHLMRGYGSLGYIEGDLPITEQTASEVFSLPMYPSLKEEDQQTVCNTLLKVI